MKILISGGGGFLGSQIIKQGHQSATLPNAKFISLARNYYSELENFEVQQIQVDLSASKAGHIIKNKIAVGEVDLLIHTAAKAGIWGSYSDYFQQNVVATQNILQIGMDLKISKMIFTSTPSVMFSTKNITDADENLSYPEDYLNYYAQTKSMAEKYFFDFIKKNNIQGLALRPHLLFGENDPHILPRLYQKAVKGRLWQVGRGENLVDVTPIEDAAVAHLLACEKLMNDPEPINGKAFFIAGQNPVLLWDFIKEFLGYVNINQNLKIMPFKLAYTLGFVFEKIYALLGIAKQEPPMTRFVACQMGLDHYFKHEEVKKLLGHEPRTSISAALKKAANHYTKKQ